MLKRSARWSRRLRAELRVEGRVEVRASELKTMELKTMELVAGMAVRGEGKESVRRRLSIKRIQKIR
jgi:hypothetical protein